MPTGMCSLAQVLREFLAFTWDCERFMAAEMLRTMLAEVFIREEHGCER